MAPTVISSLQQGVVFCFLHLTLLGWTSTLFYVNGFFWLCHRKCFFLFVCFILFHSCLEDKNLYTTDLKYTVLLYCSRNGVVSISGSTDKASQKALWNRPMDSCYKTSKISWKACLCCCLVLFISAVTQKSNFVFVHFILEMDVTVWFLSIIGKRSGHALMFLVQTWFLPYYTILSISLHNKYINNKLQTNLHTKLTSIIQLPKMLINK